MVVEILFFFYGKSVWKFSAPLSHSVRRGDMDAWVPQEIHMYQYTVPSCTWWGGGVQKLDSKKGGQFERVL